MRSLLALLILAPLTGLAQLNCSFTITAENCSAMNGTVDAFVSGGTPPYSYLWSPAPAAGQGTPSIAGLADGSYDLTVTDDLGTQQTFTAVVPNDPSIGFVGDGTYAGAHAATGYGVPCDGGCNGAMAMPAAMFPGTPPYAFGWSDPTITYLGDTPLGDPVYYGFCAGQIYSYTVSDQFGCSGSSVSFSPPVVTSNTHWSVDQVVPATCGNSDGSVDLVQSGPWPADLEVVDAFGNVVLTTTTGLNTHTLTGLGAGSYTVYCLYDASACASTFTFTMPAVGPGCGSVAGTLFLDSDVDCVVDAGEPGIPYRTLQVDPGAQLVITNADGSYAGGLADGAYTLTVLDPTVVPTCPQVQPIPFNVSGNVTALTIGAGSSSPLDLAVTAVNNAARPGFAHTVWAQVQNLGSAPSDPHTLTAVLDPSLSYLNAVPAPTSTSGNIITWNLPALAAFAGASIQINTTVSTSAPLGQPVNVVLTVVNGGAEANTTNNTFTATRTITGSYDPNDKTAFTSTRQSATDYVLAQDEWIDYVIRFQNTGTDTAFTVVITDTLAAELDMATYEQGAASHPFTVSFKPGRVVEWRFADILLPDSNVNEPLSHGAVGFRIRPAQPLAVGTTLRNAADIFFDFNAPIRTNTSELVASVSTAVPFDAATGQLQVFPNPAHDRITLTSNSRMQRVRIVALDGRTVLEQRVAGERAMLDVGGLARGPYLLLLTFTDGTAIPHRIAVQ
ncbi:MAG: hypothetical protein JNL05_10655 [Flavobacteriales bacterium]|nr:hypothetical protein [Flavobacteriales bacterium]